VRCRRMATWMAALQAYMVVTSSTGTAHAFRVHIQTPAATAAPKNSPIGTGPASSRKIMPTGLSQASSSSRPIPAATRPEMGPSAASVIGGRSRQPAALEVVDAMSELRSAGAAMDGSVAVDYDHYQQERAAVPLKGAPPRGRLPSCGSPCASLRAPSE